MKDRLFIVTGASRGLGLAMALQLQERPGVELLCISRASNDLLAARGAMQWQLDLSHPVEAALRVEGWLAERRACAAATLINNAALITPPGSVDETDPLVLSQALRVGLEAPVMLSAAFIRATRGGPRHRRILNISSGLGRRAMAGSAAYCAVKAGLDHFSRSVALEQAGEANGVRIVSLAPGIIDTDMQVQLRGADPARFAAQQMFAAYKASGQLASPHDAAAAVLAFLERPDFGAQPLADVRG